MAIQPIQTVKTAASYVADSFKNVKANREFLKTVKNTDIASMAEEYQDKFNVKTFQDAYDDVAGFVADAAKGSKKQLGVVAGIIGAGVIAVGTAIGLIAKKAVDAKKAE